MTPKVESTGQCVLGAAFGAALASASVAALAAFLPDGEPWRVVLAALGAAVGAALSSLIGTYALTWPSAGLGTACGLAVALAAPPALVERSLEAACWISAAAAGAVARRERRSGLRARTPPDLVAAIHTLQLPLIVSSVAVSLVEPRPRPFVVIFSVSAFGLWGLLGGQCPLSRAEEELRARRGEDAPALGKIGFIGHHFHRVTGIVLPKGSVFGLAYAAAAATFAWYAVEALR
jgi:hypothetical protein